MRPPVVGIVGAGQLARMTAQAAIALDIDIEVLAASPGDPACVAARTVHLGTPDDLDALASMARRCDVITFDHERVPPASLAFLESLGVPVRPSAAAMAYSDKATQRMGLASLGYPVPPFAVATSLDEIATFGNRHGWPLVAKTAVDGYDGRGVFVLESLDDARKTIGDTASRLVVEPFLDIVAEISVVLARRPSGGIAVYPAVETIQRHGVCVETIFPAALDPQIAAAGQDLACAIARHLDHAGILAVELFVTPDGLLVNELAPRPHNSGHWTIDGAITSQFENHLRAVLDWPLGAPSVVAPAVATANLFGHGVGQGADEPASLLPAALAGAAARVHLYGKEPRPGRKIGHVTAAGPNRQAALAQARAARDALGAGHRTPAEAAAGAAA